MPRGSWGDSLPRDSLRKSEEIGGILRASVGTMITKEQDQLPRFILIPKIDGIADPRVGRLGARDERVVLDVLFVETDVRLGHFGHFDVGTGQLLAKELDLLVDGGRRALELHLGH